MKRDGENPFELKISMGYIGAYGSYLSGLPSYNSAEELIQPYEDLKEFAKWAIENKVCIKCRYPWVVRHHGCECGNYSDNELRMGKAVAAALKVLAYDKKYIQELADRMAEDLKGDSEYARLSRKGQVVMQRRIERYNNELKAESGYLLRIKRKKKILDCLRNATRWFRPTYWMWKFSIVKVKKVKSIPLNVVTDKEIKEMTFGNKGNQNGNICVRTKGGSVVVVPGGQINSIRETFEGGEIVAPAIKS